MAKFRSQLNRTNVAHSALQDPEWAIGFKHRLMSIDNRDDVEIDILRLMDVLGYKELGDSWNSYFIKYPESLGEPLSPEADIFFQELKDQNIYDPNFDGYRQTPLTLANYQRCLDAEISV